MILDQIAAHELAPKKVWVLELTDGRPTYWFDHGGWADLEQLHTGDWEMSIAAREVSRHLIRAATLEEVISQANAILALEGVL